VVAAAYADKEYLDNKAKPFQIADNFPWHMPSEILQKVDQEDRIDLGRPITKERRNLVRTRDVLVQKGFVEEWWAKIQNTCY
jgi:hypothetical protein